MLQPWLAQPWRKKIMAQPTKLEGMGGGIDWANDVHEVEL